MTRDKVAGARGSEAGTVVLSSGFVPKTESSSEEMGSDPLLEEPTIGRLCLVKAQVDSCWLVYTNEELGPNSGKPIKTRECRN